MQRATRHRFLVTPEGFDDIGAVLTEMGEGFEYEEIAWEDLEDPETLAGCEVLFINCASESGEESYAETIAPIVKAFVENGGTVYCSCWAVAILEAAFPGKCQHSGDFSGAVQAKVVEAGLREFLGQSKLEITLCGWWPTKLDRRFDGQVFLTGKIDPDDAFGLEEGDENNTLGEEYPLLWSFRAGRGHVIYTAFHNEEQTSAEERKLLRYLVLRPVLAKAAGAVADMAKKASCIPGREILATLDRGKRSATYVYQASGTEGLMYVLAWTDPGQMRMIITNPSGKICADLKGNSPLRFETAGFPGQWSCVIEATAVSHDNFPYVLTLATRRGTAPPAAAPAVATSPPRPVAPTPVSPSPPVVWPCYLLIDCSAAAADVSPAVGAGLSTFLRALKQLAAGNVFPAVSLVPCRNSPPSITVPQRVGQLQPINLACQGGLNLGPHLAEMSRVLAQPVNPGMGKAFVVVLLVAEPQDEYQSGAAGLKQVAQQGRANLAAIGLGSAISDKTLCGISTIPLRIREVNQASCVDGFGWLAQVAGAMVNAIAQKSGTPMNLPPLPQTLEWLR